MKKYILALLAAICFSGSGLYAQLLPLSTMQSLEGYVNRSGKYLMQIGDDSEVLGTPYLADTFSTGFLNIDGDWYRGAELRYDAYDAIFEVRLSDGIFMISPESLEADSILYNEEVFVVKDILPGDPMRLQYLALLYEKGQYALLKRYRTRLNNAVPSDGYREAKPAEYRTNPPEYIIFKNQEPVDVKGVRSIADVFDIERKKVRRFLKQNDYDLNDEKDLIMVVNYFASLSN